MPLAMTVRPADSASELLELMTGLAAISAAVLWFWIYLAASGQGDLCTSTPHLLAHCPLCYPAVFATLATIIGGWMMIGRRARP